MADSGIRSPLHGATATMFGLAMRHYQNRMYDNALCLLEFVLRHEPANAGYQLAFGKTLHALGRHDQAVTAYTRAQRLGVADADLHFYLGQCLMFLRRFDPAAQALEASIRLAALQPERAHFLAGRARELLECVARVQRKLGTASGRPSPAPAAGGRPPNPNPNQARAALRSA